MFYDVWQECERCNKKRIDVLNNDIQGFLTSRGNFVDRVEGLKIAKENKDWSTADFIRDELGKLNITVKDSKEGASWAKE